MPTVNLGHTLMSCAAELCVEVNLEAAALLFVFKSYVVLKIILELVAPISLHI